MLVLVALAVPGATVAAEDAVLRPGDGLGDPAFCTVGMILLGADGAVYAGTAGHCLASRVGGTVGNAAFPVLGTVVRAWDDAGTFDFGFLRLAPHVTWDARIRDLGGPTGHVVDPASTEAFAALRMRGHGVPASDGRAKDGVLLTDDHERFTWVGTATPGDSGAPVVVRDTGALLGIVADAAPFKDRVGTDVGPTAAAIVARMAAEGYPVTLATAQP